MINFLCLYFIWVTGLLPGKTLVNIPVAIDKALPGTASAHGKYTEFLYMLEVVNDREIYGDYCDWGYWSNSDYAGYSNLKPGYWVYFYPYWYVWSKTTDEIGLDPAAGAYGKYQGLIHILYIPDDRSEFNNYYDWGFWEGYSYGKYNDLTPGYWVYSAPNWYVWADVTDINKGG